MDKKNLHWSEIIANEVAEKTSPPYVIASGITTSGPLHPGTLCEFLFADAIAKELGKRGETHFVFVADIMDAFDSIPGPFKKYEKLLTQHLGKPLAHTPDPEGCHRSFGEHFLAEAADAMHEFGANPEIIPANELYAKGAYDEYAREYAERKDEIKEIVRVSSLRETMPDSWHPIMPICEKCGRVATTRVLGYSNGTYEYACDQDVEYTKGCGHKGRAKITDHKYKLLFRLDWPARQDFLNVKIEGGSVDHHTKGGTIATVYAVHRQFFKKPGPVVFYKFGFLKYKGKKYSKSKGIGHTVSELMQLLPLPVLEYALLRPDLQEDKELVLEEQTLFTLVSDFEYAASIDPEKELERADRKKAVAYSLTQGKGWKAPLQDILVTYALYKDWKDVGKRLNDPKGVTYLAPYTEQWLSRKWIPDKYVFELKEAPHEHGKLVKQFASSLNEKMEEQEIQNLVYEIAKKNNVQPPELFKSIYLALISKPQGPKLARFVKILGIKRVKELIG
ncbi:MAG: lysine--tRNA ligase [Candidatus Micrarchaeota archaeon]